MATKTFISGAAGRRGSARESIDRALQVDGRSAFAHQLEHGLAVVVVDRDGICSATLRHMARAHNHKQSCLHLTCPPTFLPGS